MSINIYVNGEKVEIGQIKTIEITDKAVVNAILDALK